MVGSQGKVYFDISFSFQFNNNQMLLHYEKQIFSVFKEILNVKNCKN